MTQDISSRILTVEAWGSNLRVVHVEFLAQNRIKLDFPTSITILPPSLKSKQIHKQIFLLKSKLFLIHHSSKNAVKVEGLCKDSKDIRWILLQQ
jgi:hypothetical protein